MAILYEMLPTILMASHLRTEKDARKLAAIAVVAAGYGGDMSDELRDLSSRSPRACKMDCHLCAVPIVSLRYSDYPFESFEPFLYPHRDYRNESFGLS